MRALAKICQLNINTLSLIENGKTSPSVSTLQQIAIALGIPINAFFEIDLPETNIVFQKAGDRSQANFTHGTLEDLGLGMKHKNFEPFLVYLEGNSSSGDALMSHPGVEFVFCLEGRLRYWIDGRDFLIEPGDSLMFDAQLAHRWHNAEATPTRSLLVLCPAGENDQPVGLHFTTAHETR